MPKRRIMHVRDPFWQNGWLATKQQSRNNLLLNDGIGISKWTLIEELKHCKRRKGRDPPA